jgi:tyrosine-protein phosphatase YwqE
MSLFDLIRRSPSKRNEPLDLKWMKVDMHSHLIPGIDDGAKTVEESLELIRILHGFGLKKLIMTPHVMSEFYRNSPEVILEGLEQLRNAVAKEGIAIELEAAAEYYIDEIFFEKIEKKQKLLTFGGNKILVETGFLSKPQILIETFFQLEMAGYQPVYAHPERYLYLHQDSEFLDSLADRNIFFQLNLLSLTGYYSKPIKKFAEKLIDRGLIKLIGTDCHNIRYLEALERLPQEKYYHKLMDLTLLNPDL